jgi:peptide subunit release factor 1 (eRF1)
MISKMDLAPVKEYKAVTGRVLSVYLDVDQSNAANLNRKFEAAFHAKVNEIGRTLEEEDEQTNFDFCVREVRNTLAAYQPRGRGLMILARSTGSLWMRELNTPIATEVFWGHAPHVQQFVETLDEFETYGVVVTDRSHSRIFTVKLGAIDKHADIQAMNRVRHMKTAGTDHLYSQSHLQRKADEHALSHLKRTVELLEHIAQSAPFDRLVLAGATEATSELFRLLPKSMRAKVIASASLSANAPEDRILDEVLDLGRKAERAQEMEKVEILITASAKGHSAITAVDATLNALNERCVRELIYSQGFARRGGVCESCDTVFPNDAMNCTVCSLPVKPADDLIEIAIGMALAQGANVEQLRGEAAEKLKAFGGIGAFLRY